MNQEYWSMKANRSALPLLDKPCNDCAVTCGFYVPYADELLEQSYDIREKAMQSWFCHNDPSRACRGVRNYIESKRKSGDRK